MNPLLHRRARSERLWPGALSPDPRDPDIVRAKGARADRAFRKGTRDMMAWRPAPTAGCPDGDPHGQDGPPRAGADVGMHPAHQRGGAAKRSRSAALGSVAGRLPDRQQPSAGPGPERNGAVPRAGGRGPRTRPRHRQRILQEHPEPPDRHQLQREPSLACSPRRQSANVRSSPSGKNARAHHRQPAHRQPARQQPTERLWPRRCTSPASSCPLPASAAASPAKNSGGGTPPAQQGRGPARAAPRAVPGQRPLRGRRASSTLLHADVDVPGEVSIIGYDDSRLARLTHINLTTVPGPGTDGPGSPSRRS